MHVEQQQDGRNQQQIDALADRLHDGVGSGLDDDPHVTESGAGLAATVLLDGAGGKVEHVVEERDAGETCAYGRAT